MIELLTAAENVPFTAALLVMLFIGVLEGLASLVGVGFLGMLDSVLPDGFDHAHGVHFEPASTLTKVLGWLRVGKVPLLMLLVVLLCSFGIVGLGMQAAVAASTGAFLPAIAAAPAALLASLPLTRAGGALLERFIPQDESTAISEATFVGRRATVTTGIARRGAGAQAKLRDEHGQTHYVMVEPDEGEGEFPSGSSVILVRKDGPRFFCIRDSTGAADA